MKKINGDLTFDEMSSVMSEILNGKNSDEEIAKFLRELSNNCLLYTSPSPRD